MRPGPVPKPSALKKLQGTYRSDRARGEVFPPSVEDLSPPDWLSDRAQEKWNELAPMLAADGLLTECDLDTLALYCQTWIHYLDAAKALEEGGTTSVARSGYEQVSPYVTIAKNCLADLIKIGDRLGLNPSTRTRLQVQPSVHHQEDLLA